MELSCFIRCLARVAVHSARARMLSRTRLRAGLVLIVLVFLSGPCLAQTVSVDAIKNTEDLESALIAIDSAQSSRACELLAHHRELITRALWDHLFKKATSSTRVGDLPKAIHFYTLAKQAATVSENRDLVASAAAALGNTHKRAGRFQESIKEYEEAIEILRTSSVGLERLAAAELLTTLCSIQTRINLYAEARQTSSECLALLPDLQAHTPPVGAYLLDEIIATAWANEAQVSMVDGDYARALSCFRTSLEQSQKVARKSPYYQSAVTGRILDIAWVYRTIGDYATSLDYINQVLDRARESGDNLQLSRALHVLGVLHSGQGDFLSAKRYFAESLQISKAKGDQEGTAVTLVSLGIVDQRQEHFEAALLNLNEALRIAETSNLFFLIPSIQESLGSVYQDKGDYNAASRYYDLGLPEAERIGDKNNQSLFFVRKAEICYAQNRFEDALRLADAAHQISRKANLPAQSYQSLTLKGKALLALGDSKAANTALDAAIDVIEWMRARAAGDNTERSHFFQGGRIAAFHVMIDLLVAQRRSGEALLYSERAKARALLDVLQYGKHNLKSEMTAQEREHEQRLQNEIASLNSQIYSEKQQALPTGLRSALLRSRLETVRLEHESLRNRLYAAHPDLKTRRGETDALTIDQISSLLPDGRDAALEYVVQEDKTLLFVITKDTRTDKAPRIDSFSIAATKRELLHDVGSFRERLANPNIWEEKASKRLFDLLLGPARELIATKTKLVVVPDGILWDLPFQALKQPNGKYLIEDYAVLYAPSLSVLREMTSRSAKAGGPRTTSQAKSVDEASDALFALGNPALSERTVKVASYVHRDEKLLPLPDAETEVKSIARFYDTVTSTVYVGAKAREQVAKSEMPRYRTLHFATHGLLDDTNPMYSHIVLARSEADKDEDGLLEAWEIMDLDLKADMVVLSACDTARGQIGAGEGVVGMSWAFFAAGCPTTVVSQWKVDSASTAQLMIEFHRHLVSKTPGQQPGWKKPDALRKAMLTVMKNPRFKDPYYWAGFVVVGAG